MSYGEVKALIRGTYAGYRRAVSPDMVARRINSTRQVAVKALEMLLKEGFFRKTGDNEYRVTVSPPRFQSAWD